MSFEAVAENVATMTETINTEIILHLMVASKDYTGVKNENLEKMFWFGWQPQERAVFCNFCYLRNYTACSSLADFML